MPDKDGQRGLPSILNLKDEGGSHVGIRGRMVQAEGTARANVPKWDCIWYI